ncbi:DUF2254 domain-containing protein [Martelella alba]|uniref:DUF2254 domain-containing protein n=1 Tax=Martelella alba TaxID=2590451 RepID=A0ABY2SIP9_9HYPH|nr:DUF2254 domain-containing protein [Martelella alba]TKI04683.1 DUF2254 domain-containing protein [Martelella alba]
MRRWQWLIAQVMKRLWVKATLIGALGILAALIAAVMERFITWKIPGIISAEAVDSLLTIIASSMLAVTTFSLSIMVSAYGAATNNVTPRATKLLIEDSLTQTVLSTFIGSFLFGIVGLVVLQTGAYGERGRFILFLVTVSVIILIVVALLRWIDHLTRLGRVGETTYRVEDAARRAIKARLEAPFLGGSPYDEQARAAAGPTLPVLIDTVGYVQHIDMPALSATCRDKQTVVYVEAMPGTFVYPHVPVARFRAAGDDEDNALIAQSLSTAFSLGDERSFEQDPRFGLAVMTEIASRALSPAVNDSGTALDVIGRTTRLLFLWGEGYDTPAKDDIAFPDVHVRAIDTDDLFEDAFMLIARDGASSIEIQSRIQKALLALSQIEDPAFKTAALRQSDMAFERAAATLTLASDIQRLRLIKNAFAQAAPQWHH